MICDSTTTLKKHVGYSASNLLTVTLVGLSSDDTIYTVSVHFDFLILTVDRSLIVVAGWWLDEWDHTIKKAKNVDAYKKRTKHDLKK